MTQGWSKNMKPVDQIEPFATMRQEAREQAKCALCPNKINGREDFKDDLSWREYRISLMCQECQDDVFGEEV